MPKRKCDDSEFDYLSKKLKKLERKIKRVRRRNPSSSDSDNLPPRNRIESDSIAAGDDVCQNNLPEYFGWYNDVPESVEDCDACAQLCATDPPPRALAYTATPPPTLATVVDPTPPPPSATNAVAGTAVPLTVTGPAATIENQVPTVPQEPVPELDPDLMKILGEDPTCIKEYGNEIQKDLAIRLNHIAISGLSKENRKEIKEKYAVPTNCKLIKAPTLNPEIRASLIESQAKRDKGIENKQVMTSCALSSLSAAITLLLSSEYKNPELLKMMMDTARILGDIQHSDSVLRRFFILSTVKKELKDQLEKTKIDETLFGNNLSETLKSAKTINKSGADIRSASTIKNTVQKSTKTPNKPLNYGAPPAGRRPFPPPPPPPGGAKNARTAYSAPSQRQTTTTPTHRNASKTSSRQPQPRYRR